MGTCRRRKQQQLVWEDVQRAMEAEAQATSVGASSAMPASLAADLVREVMVFFTVALLVLCDPKYAQT